MGVMGPFPLAALCGDPFLAQEKNLLRKDPPWASRKVGLASNVENLDPTRAKAPTKRASSRKQNANVKTTNVSYILRK
jgi:hypothetical protein